MTIAEQITRAKADLDAVFEAGKKAEWSVLWDSLQDKGARTSYNYFFHTWADDIFYPKYDLICVGNANAMFASNKIVDFKGRLQECGVTFDTSGATSVQELFAYAQLLTRVPVISTVSAPNAVYLFTNDYALVEVEKVILKADGSQIFTSTFNRCENLVSITFEGVIGQNINFQWSTKLSKASITNIMEHLSTTASGMTASFSQTAIVNAFGSTDNADWVALKNSRSNWTIALA